MAWPEHTSAIRSKAVKRPFGRLATLHPAIPLAPALPPRAFTAFGPEAGIGEEPEEPPPVTEENMFELIEGKWEPVIGKEGAAGKNGTNGAEGLQGQWFWELAGGFPPAKGAMQADSATPATVTRLRFNNTDGFGASVKAALKRIVENDVIVIRDRENPNHAASYKVTEAPAEKEGYFEIRVEHIEDNFAGEAFANPFPAAVSII